MAQEEVMQAEVGNAPMREAIARLERQYEVDKKNALGNPSIIINSISSLLHPQTNLSRKRGGGMAVLRTLK